MDSYISMFKENLDYTAFHKGVFNNTDLNDYRTVDFLKYLLPDPIDPVIRELFHFNHSTAINMLAQCLVEKGAINGELIFEVSPELNFATDNPDLWTEEIFDDYPDLISTSVISILSPSLILVESDSAREDIIQCFEDFNNNNDYVNFEIKEPRLDFCDLFIIKDYSVLEQLLGETYVILDRCDNMVLVAYAKNEGPIRFVDKDSFICVTE